MADTVECSRCGRTAEGLAKPPYAGELGRQLQARVCAECWAEWQRMEVMVINELRLNFMDPGSMDLLAEQVRRFFALEAPESTGPSS
jgi:Fe-S cluster biosynthesis and repair protein YggX